MRFESFADKLLICSVRELVRYRPPCITMASAKKYQDVDLYALLGVHAEATEKEVGYQIYYVFLILLIPIL